MHKTRLILLLIVFSSKLISQTDEELQGKAFLFWQGTKSEMTIKEFVSYFAPVFWYSSDEPSLKRAKSKGIMIPQNFPFRESEGKPVVYYQVKYVFTKKINEAQHFCATEILLKIHSARMQIYQNGVREWFSSWCFLNKLLSFS